MRLLTAFALAALCLATSARADDEAAKGSIGIQIKIEEGKIVVVEPIKDSPAEKAGIKSGDVLVKINDFAIKQADADEDDLKSAVEEVVKSKPGSKMKVVVKRDEKEMTIEVTVGKRSVVLPKKD